mmetsp:Transcript_8032/g.22591  ORF Transcript_8032/g.22591 Transcript_8032/m.22591 type:complete len:290 (-) Transcript_8032:723-1592(-)
MVPVRLLVQLEQLPATGGRTAVVDEQRPGLLLEHGLDPLVQLGEPRGVVVVEDRVLPQDQDPHVRVPGVDRPHGPPQALDGKVRDVALGELLPAEALLRLGLIVVEPGREDGDVAPAGVGRDVRHPHLLLAEVAPGAVLAPHGVPRDAPEAVRAAALPALVGEVPAVPPDLAEAGCLQVGEGQGVVAELGRRRVEPGLRARGHDGQFVPEPAQIEVQLVHPGHPEDVAGPDDVHPYVSTDVEQRAVLLHVLPRPIEREIPERLVQLGCRRRPRPRARHGGRRRRRRRRG